LWSNISSRIRAGTAQIASRHWSQKMAALLSDDICIRFKQVFVRNGAYKRRTPTQECGETGKEVKGWVSSQEETRKWIQATTYVESLCSGVWVWCVSGGILDIRFNDPTIGWLRRCCQDSLSPIWFSISFWPLLRSRLNARWRTASGRDEQRIPGWAKYHEKSMIKCVDGYLGPHNHDCKLNVGERRPIHGLSSKW
jgi:hypothetical protein